MVKNKLLSANKALPKERSDLSSFIKKKNQFVLTVGDDGAILVYIQGNVVVNRVFAALSSQQDVTKLLTVFALDPNAPVSVLIDIIDQSYVQQSLPAVSQLNIGKLVKRRLERDFPEDTLKGFIQLGRANDGRKDWNYLFVSCPSGPPLSEWLDHLNSIPNLVTGIYLLPIELSNVVIRLQKASFSRKKSNLAPQVNLAVNANVAADDTNIEPNLPEKISKKKKVEGDEAAAWQIIVTHNKVGGFRQAAYKNGKIVFTRLISNTSESSIDIVAGNVEQELINTLEYLRRLSFDEKDGYDVTLIISPELKLSLANSSIKGTHVLILTPSEAADLLKCPTAANIEDRFSDVVVGAAFSQNKHILKLSTPLTQKIYMLALLIKVSRIGFAGLTLIMLCLMVYMQIQIFSLSHDISVVEQKKIDVLGQENTLEKASFNSKEAARINDMISLYKILSGDSPSPLTILRDFYSVKGKDVLVKDITWESKDVSKSKRGGAASAPPVNMPPPGMNNGMPSMAGGKIAKKTAPAESDRYTTTTKLDVEFANTGSSYDSLFENFDQFVKRLKNKFVNYNVETTKLPEKINFDEKNKVVLVTVIISGPKDMLGKVH